MQVGQGGALRLQDLQQIHHRVVQGEIVQRQPQLPDGRRLGDPGRTQKNHLVGIGQRRNLPAQPEPAIVTGQHEQQVLAGGDSGKFQWNPGLFQRQDFGQPRARPQLRTQPAQRRAYLGNHEGAVESQVKGKSRGETPGWQCQGRQSGHAAAARSQETRKISCSAPAARSASCSM